MTAHRLTGLASRLSRIPPLPLTSLAIAALVIGPGIALLRLPRPLAQGLEQLMDTSSLLQSFAASPQRPVPALWQERLGAPLANRVWRLQRRTWWQFWGPHADGAPFLALEASSLPVSRGTRLAPAGAVSVGDLVVISPDPLSRQLLLDRLRPRQRPSRGLQRRCLKRMQQGQAVYWNPNALGVILGPVSPLLQPFQAGCLTLALEPGGLRWQGEAAAVDGVLAAAHQDTPTPDAAVLPPLADDTLLEIRGGSLDPLLQGLLSRQLIRDPLGQRYGLSADRLSLLRQAPFRLRLRPRPSGPYQASLELQLITGRQRAPWAATLAGVARALAQQGLSDRPAAATTATAPGSGGRILQAPGPASTTAESARPGDGSGSVPAAPSPSAVPAPAGAGSAAAASERVVWRRPDGQVVGGWRWLRGRAGEEQLVLFLGPEPARFEAVPAGATERPAPGQLVLRVRPQAMAGLGLLPAEMPPLVQRSEQLVLRTFPQGQGRGRSGAVAFSLLSGALQLPR